MKRWLALIPLVLFPIVLGTFGRTDDTDIYTVDTSIQPNVLIFFDNSDSMNSGPPYSDTLTYTGTYDSGRIYRRECVRYNPWNRRICERWDYRIYNGTFTDANHDGIDDLNDAIRSGNWLNYANQSPTPIKVNIAKAAMKSLIDNTEGVRFGLMIVNGDTNEGGQLLAPCGTEKATLKSLVDGIVAYTMTPLAETLTHCGVYFKGGFNNPSTRRYPYPTVPANPPSPVQYSCQANYVIIITDGLPTYDQSENILSTFLGDRANWDKTVPPDPENDDYARSGVQHYLDDVAKVLYAQGVAHSTFGQIRITTYTIGFGVDHQLLQMTAREGGGKYLTAWNADQLSTALESYVAEITTRATIFVAPVVPANKTTSGDRIYVPFAYPNAVKKFWQGDLKKFGLTSDGMIVDANGAQATDTQGNFLETAVPYWSVDAALRSRTTARNVYTHVLPPYKIYNTPNLFRLENTQITAETLGDPTHTRDEVMSYVLGQDALDEDGDGNTAELRDYVLGDILHSSPAVVKYAGRTITYFGANDGMLHAIDDANGSEMWAFIPTNLLPKLKDLIEGTTHPYLVDSSPKVASLYFTPQRTWALAGPLDPVEKRILIFGQRKGGSYYYALDVTNPDQPEYLWEISPAVSGFGELGETWSEPFLGMIQFRGTPTAAAFFGGGYKADNSKGAAVYGVDVLTGALLWAKDRSNTPGAAMQYSIPSTVMALDVNNDGYLDRLYVGDMGGQIWAFARFPATDGERPAETGDVGTWGTRLLFQSGGGRKIFEPPDVVMEIDGYYLYFGTGDRESPREAIVSNRLYCLKDRCVSDASYALLLEGNMANVTSNLVQTGTAAERLAAWQSLMQGYGWFIQLENPGEKALAPATVFQGVAYFTTFTPVSDPCSIGGDARVYALRYLTGGAFFNWSAANDAAQPVLAKSDRSIKLARGGIPTEVVILIRPPAVGGGGLAPASTGTSQAMATSAGGSNMIDSPEQLSLTPYAWREVNP